MWTGFDLLWNTEELSNFFLVPHLLVTATETCACSAGRSAAHAGGSSADTARFSKPTPFFSTPCETGDRTVQKDSFIKPAFPLASAISLTATGSSRFSFPHLPSPSVFCGVTFQLTSGGFSRGNVARKRNRTLTDTKTSEACVAAGSSTYRPPSCSQEGVSPRAAGREPLAAGLRCECSPCLVPEAHLQVSLSKSPATALSCDTSEASQVVIVTRDLSSRV